MREVDGKWVNAGWGGEALFLETETRPSHSDKWGGGGRWQEGKLQFCLPWDSRVPGPYKWLLASHWPSGGLGVLAPWPYSPLPRHFPSPPRLFGGAEYSGTPSPKGIMSPSGGPGIRTWAQQVTRDLTAPAAGREAGRLLDGKQGPARQFLSVL